VYGEPLPRDKVRDLDHAAPAAPNASGALLTVNRAGQLCSIDIFSRGQAPHTLICGATGSGKSVLAQNLIASYPDAKIFIIDRGRSFKTLTENLGGRYYEITEGAFSPFPPYKEKLGDDELNMLVKIIACATGVTSREEASHITRAVKSIYDAKNREIVMKMTPQEALLMSLRSIPEAKGIALVWEEFVSGRFRKTFKVRDLDLAVPSAHKSNALDHVATPDVSPDGCRVSDPALEQDETLHPSGPAEGETARLRSLTLFELGANIDTEVLPLQVMSLVMSIINECSRDVERKIVVIDEAWAILAQGEAAKFLELMFRTFRKYNAACVIITQQPQDLCGEAGGAILMNTHNKFLLKQPRDVAHKVCEILNLTEVEVQTIASLRVEKPHFSEFLYLGERDCGVYRLYQTPEMYRLTTTDPNDRVNGLTCAQVSKRLTG